MNQKMAIFSHFSQKFTFEGKKIEILQTEKMAAQFWPPEPKKRLQIGFLPPLSAQKWPFLAFFRKNSLLRRKKIEILQTEKMAAQFFGLPQPQ